MKAARLSAVFCVLSFLSNAIVLAENRSEGAKYIPRHFIGNWSEKDEHGDVINKIVIKNDQILWDRRKESRLTISARQCKLTDDGRVISFFIKELFGSIGAIEFRGQREINLLVKDTFLILTFKRGELKIPEEQGFSQTWIAEEKTHTYTKN